jgi:hypothetical protein
LTAVRIEPRQIENIRSNLCQIRATCSLGVPLGAQRIVTFTWHVTGAQVAPSRLESESGDDVPRCSSPPPLRDK